MIKFLIEHGAKTDIMNDLGQTPAYFASILTAHQFGLTNKVAFVGNFEELCNSKNLPDDLSKLKVNNKKVVKHASKNIVEIYKHLLPLFK